MSHELEPVFVAPLFPDLHRELLDLLRSLAPEDWNKPTAAGAWRVRDVVAHLLDGDLRTLTFQRDGVLPPPPRGVAGNDGLLAYLNGQNAEWVQAARRIGPRVMFDFLEVTGPQVSAFVAGLDPHAPACFAVAWAGDEQSPNWFHIGREYTERWHHQQQVRDAVGAPPLFAPRFFRPVLDVSVRALPHTYGNVASPLGHTLRFVVTGDSGGVWALIRQENGWTLREGEPANAAAHVTVDADTAWRIFFKALSPDEAEARATLSGDRTLCLVLLGTRAVMA